jgi:two-component system response regulator YesN
MYKVLIVDDEPMVIHGLCRQIDWESYGLELAGTAETGESALSIFKQKTIDILFTDVCMPNMDGLTLISAAKQQNPFVRSVVISAHNEFDYVKKALLLGVENYLLKPIDQIELGKTIEKTIDNLNRDRINIQQDTSELSEFRSNILDRWVNAAIQDYEFYERAELLHINISARQYQVCVIDIIDTDTESQKLLNAKLMLREYESNFFPAFQGECFIDRFNRIVVVLFEDELCKKQNEIELFLKKGIADGLKRGIKTYAGVSPISDGVENVARYYKDAVEYLNYRFIDPYTDYIFCGELINKFNLFGCEPILIQFTKALTEEDTANICDIVKKHLNTCSSASIKTVKQCMIPFLITLIKHMNESGQMSEMLPDTATREFPVLKSIESMQYLKKWFLDIIYQSVDVMGRRKKLLHILVQRTLSIVKKNYHNTDLSLKTIAASLKVSPAYLGQLFKEATGKYFNDYLTETRLQASRNLLLETDLKIREILYRIGMSNQSYYNRVFKKAYGMSPLALRYHKECGREKLSHN